MRGAILLLMLAAVCPAQSIRSVAVSDVHARGLASDLALGMGARVRTVFDSLPAFALIGRDAMRDKMGSEAFAASVQCDNLDCLTEMCLNVGAVAAVTTSLRNLGGTYVITLKLYDIKNRRLENLVTRKYEGPAGGLGETVAAAALELSGQKKAVATAEDPESLGPRRGGLVDEDEVRLLKKYHPVRFAAGYLRSEEGILAVYEDRIEFKARREDRVVPFTEIASMEFVSRYDDKERLKDQVMCVYYDTGSGQPKKYLFYGIGFDQAREISGFTGSNLYVKRQVYYGKDN